MRDYDLPRRPPPQASRWQRLKYWLELWAIATTPPRGAGNALWQGFRLAVPLLLLMVILLVVCVLPLLLLGLSGPLITGFFFWLSRQEGLTSPIAEIIYALLYTLLGLAALLAAHRWWARIPRDQLPQQGLGLFFSRAGRTFWTGTALCVIAAAQLLFLAYAHWLNILFWVVTGCVVLLPYLLDIFKFVLRRFRRLAQRQA